jgi:hypothetical protein
MRTHSLKLMGLFYCRSSLCSLLAQFCSVGLLLLYVLIKISIFKFITLPKKEIARLKRQGQHVPNSKRNVPTAPKALELVLVYDQHLAPVIANMPAGAKMRDAVASKEVLILMYDNLESLQACFEKFAQMKSEDGSISLSEFSVFAMSAGFCGGGKRRSRRGLQKSSRSIMEGLPSTSILLREKRRTRE